MIQAVSLSRLDKYSFFSAVPQSWSFFLRKSSSSLLLRWNGDDFVLCGCRGSVDRLGLGGRIFFQFWGILFCFWKREWQERTWRQTKIVEIAWLLSTSLHKAFFYEKSSVVSHIQKSFRSISPFFSAKSCCHPFDYGQILKIAVLPVTNIESWGTVYKKRSEWLFFVYRNIQTRPVRPRK